MVKYKIIVLFFLLKTDCLRKVSVTVVSPFLFSIGNSSDNVNFRIFIILISLHRKWIALKSYFRSIGHNSYYSSGRLSGLACPTSIMSYHVTMYHTGIILHPQPQAVLEL